ncbi:hypothetical protein HU200_026561 [Digitaria exilis]|uniref:DUF1618 domain-containing protein n=1 Tax=Digitaria exilis TaxID=1010633 RepID=A0A835BW73_9POAL|nr:hypothetical protein HU200_026561 [Digitaria exilis]
MDPRLHKVLVPPPSFPSEDPNPLPGSILLEPHGYISDRTNSTTADGFTRDGKPIRVTFWVSDPPRASFFTVYIHEAGRSAIGNLPTILNTEEDIVLLRIPIRPPGGNLHAVDSDYFVYLAGTKHKRPSLQRIPTPPVLFLSEKNVGLLRCRTRYLIALLCRSFHDDEKFDLHLYNSKSKSWSSRSMLLGSPEAKKYDYASKVITIGGKRGSVGWVDLWQGILICDLLTDSNSLSYIPLPSLVHRLPGGPPLLVRDIIVFRKECIKFFDMCLYVGSDFVTTGWEAATWRREVSSTEWKKGHGIKVSNDQAFPNLQEDGRRGLALKGAYLGFPALSLHDDHVVYIMDKRDLLDKEASVIAVDMNNKTLKGVADFVSGRPLGYTLAYFQSAISMYLGLWASTR